MTPQDVMHSETKSGKDHALIMKGGGIKGLAFAGALEVLYDHGYKFNWFVGTSAGAISAILLASGKEVSELKEILQKQDFRKFKDASHLKAIYNLIFKNGFYEAKTFEVWLENLISKKEGNKRTELNELPYRTTIYACSVDRTPLIFDSEKKETSNTPVTFAARCSMAIPYVFTPESFNGSNVYDGGLQNNFPLEDFSRNNPDTDFIGLFLGSEIYDHSEEKSDSSVLEDILKITTESPDKRALQDEKNKGKIIIIDPNPITALDFDLTKEEKEFLIATGRVAAKKFLLKKKESDVELNLRFSELEAKKEEESLKSTRERITEKRWRPTKWRKTILVLFMTLSALLFLPTNWFISNLIEAALKISRKWWKLVLAVEIAIIGVLIFLTIGFYNSLCFDDCQKELRTNSKIVAQYFIPKSEDPNQPQSFSEWFPGSGFEPSGFTEEYFEERIPDKEAIKFGKDFSGNLKEIKFAFSFPENIEAGVMRFQINRKYFDENLNNIIYDSQYWFKSPLEEDSDYYSIYFIKPKIESVVFKQKTN